MATVTKEKTKAFALRIPESLFDAIDAVADTERRSVNAQIIVYLERGLKAEKDAAE